MRLASKALNGLIVCCLSAVLFTVGAKSLSAKPLRVATFNIKWYGNGGSVGQRQGEPRDPYLRQFMGDHLADLDVIFFQEIVDVDRLDRLMDDFGMNCSSYHSNDPNHQHVVLCLKESWRLKRPEYDNNWAVEEVQLGNHRLRPALHGVLEDTRGREVAYLVGVHLKAYPDETEKRQDQMQELAEVLAERAEQLPLIIAGDFNSFASRETGAHKHDKYIFKDILRREGLVIDLVDNGDTNTYRTNRFENQLDQIYIRDAGQLRGEPKVIGPCNENNGQQQSWSLTWYNQNISDHCPMVISIEI